MFRQFKIAHRFVVAIALAVVVVSSVSFYLNQRSTGRVLDGLEQAALAEVAENIVAEIASESLRAQAMAAVVASIPQVQQAFAERDRATLEGYFAEGFGGLKKAFGVRQFQFHEPPARSFLRVHKLNKSGDDLSSFRLTVVKTNREQAPVRGLEVGVAGLGIRGIVPVSHAGRHVGSVEFGLSLGQDFVERIAARHGIDLGVFLQREQRLQAFASTSAEQMLDDAQLRKAVDGESVFSKVQRGDVPTAVYAKPFADFSGAPIGVLVVAQDRSHYQAQVDAIGQQSLLAAIVSAVILVAIVWLIARGVTRPICRTTASMQAIAHGDGDLSTRLDDKGNDEMAALSRAYNAFAAKLEETINAIVTTTNELAAMVSRFSDLSEHTHAGTRRQQEQVSQVATAMTEMSATVSEVAQNTVDTADAARRVDQQAQSGQVVVRHAMESINTLADEVRHAVERIRSVEQDSERIGSVLEVIRGIADQTNLLALNAAIEAARAGEQGRGFAVVADEVRTLAQRTQDSTREIQEMIESLQSGVENTVAVLETSMRQAGDSVEQSSEAHAALVAITESIDTITAMSSQIATAAEEQSAVAEDINRSVVDITQVAESTACDAQSSVAETETLSGAVETLVGLMSQFKTGNRHLNELQRAKSAHLAWKGKLRGFLDGKASLDHKAAVSHHDCTFGKWYDSVGKAEFGHLPEAKAIESPHKELHDTIRQIVEMQQRGEIDGAARAYQRVGPLSEKIVALIDQLESRIRVSGQGRA
jgi:methyl-accepting chemotaxis protein